MGALLECRKNPDLYDQLEKKLCRSTMDSASQETSIINHGP
jgi:hypothetical protein